MPAYMKTVKLTQQAELLVVEDIGPMFAPLVPITLKLRSQKARRDVVAQVIDYVSRLSAWFSRIR